MNNKRIELAQNATLYTIGVMATKIISFLLLPFNSSHLTVVEFGEYDFALVLISLLLPIVSLALPETMYRFFQSSNNKNKSFSIFFTTLLFLAFILSLLTTFFMILFKQKYSFLIGSIIFISIINSFYLYIARAEERIPLYLWGNIICVIVQAISNIFLINYTPLKIEAILISNILGYFSSIVYMRLNIKYHIQLYSKKEYFEILPSLFRYAIPLIPNSLNWWIINSINKFYIRIFCKGNALGIFAMASKLPNFVSSFSSVIYMASMDTILKKYDTEEREEIFGEVMDFMVKIIFPATALCILFTKIFIIMFISKDYLEALVYIPLLYLSVLLSIVASFFSIIYHCEKITYKNLITSIWGSIGCVLSGVILTWKGGLLGAVCSMLIANLLVSILRMIDAQKYIHLKIEYRTLLICVGEIVVSCIGFYILNFTGLIIMFILALGVAIYINRYFVIEIFQRIKK